MSDEKDNLDIPDFLKRKVPVKAAAASVELVMSEDQVVEQEAPEAPVKVRKPRVKANGAAKVAPKAAKPVKKAAKVAKAAPKAKRASKAPKAAIALDAFGLRAGSMKSKAAAMYATKRGATLNEIKAAVGSLQLNVLTSLKKQGWKVTKTLEKGDGTRKITRYKLSK